MKYLTSLVAGGAMLAASLHAAEAGQSGRVGLGADVSSPWVLQFKPKKRMANPADRARVARARARANSRITTGSVSSSGQLRSSIPVMPDAELLPQIVDYYGSEKPGTIVVDTPARRLFLVMEGGKARRYAIGVGKPGFEWAGTHKVTRKAEWPDWRPPASMIARERKKGRILPTFMPGGPENPLGARALYLGSTIYRIHGTNQDWSIGKAVSSGCIRMRNQDVMDLYERVRTGTRVKVI